MTTAPELTHVTTIRLTEDEAERLDRAAAERAISRSALIRGIVLGYPLPGPRPPRVNMEMVAQLNRLGVLINQTLRWMHRIEPDGHLTMEEAQALADGAYYVKYLLELLLYIRERLQ